MKIRQNKERKIKILIIGLGNILAGDDGFGSIVIDHLKSSPLPHGIEVIEGGTDAFALLPYLEKTERVILLDVIQTGGRPGTLYRIPLSMLPVGDASFSQHQVSLLTLYQLPFTRWQLSLPDGVLFAVEVTEIEIFKQELSDQVKDSIPTIVERIWQEIRNYLEVELYPI